MPRQARKKSSTGIYHIMLRAVNKQQIFEDVEDYRKFLYILSDYKSICEFKIYAYCLMGNHIHLLIQEIETPIEQIMKRITTKFVYWYNAKYERSGHLFQDRYKSEPVENDAYLFTVIRYIHQNPIKGGICKNIEDYKYSSYKEYFKKSDIVDSDFIFSLMDRDEFVRFNHQSVTEKCLDVDYISKIIVTDEQAQEIIEKYSKCKTIAEFQALDRKSRDKYLALFREKGLSIRQISRLTGTTIGVIRKFN